MLSELFEPYQFTIAKQGNAAVICYQIVGPLPTLSQILFWDGSSNLEIILKPEMPRFVAVLCNGAILENILYNAEKLIEFIDRYYVTLTPDEKLDTVLDYISKSSTYDGQLVKLRTPSKQQLVKMYFTNVSEWNFYLNNAQADKYVRLKTTPTAQGVASKEYGLTVTGLTRMIRISEGRKSNQCFVAMAFTDDMFDIAENAIKPALSFCGFTYLSVSEQQIDSDRTINDAILAGIKKARFTIADFTHHRGGVYFEAGYALGRGQKVIYTCHQDHMQNAHFDIRNYQHVVWSDAVDFNKKLIDKIEAFIKD